MAGTAVRFKTGYQKYDPATIFQVDQATKTLSPYGSGPAFQEAGFQFGQESVADAAAYQGYNVGPIINARAAALDSVKTDLNQFQNETFNASNTSAKRQSSTLLDNLDAENKAISDAMAQFDDLKAKAAALPAPDFAKAYTDLRTSQGVPALENEYAATRATRRELPYVQRSGTGNAAVATEGQLGDQITQADIPLGIKEANTLDRLNLAQNFISTSLNLKEKDYAASQDALSHAIALIKDSLSIHRAQVDRFEGQQKDKQAREDAALQFRLENDIKTPFFNVGGTIYDSGSLEDIPDEKTFQQKYGMTLQDAEARGLVGKLDAGAQQDKALVLDLASKYPDAGILTSDTLQSAQAKLNKSRIYQEQVRPPIGAGGGGPGTLTGTNIVDKNTDAAVRSIIASRPGDGGYGDTYNAIKNKYGEAVANSYDKVYQDVFNKGVSVDAAFNNLKLGASSTGLVDASGKPVKLTAGQQSTIADWTTLSDLADQTLSLGDRIGFSGVGGGYQGSIAQFMAKQFGSGTQEEEQLRNLITNIKGTLAKARGGTSFTPNEQKLLDSYTPGIDDSPTVIKAKLASLKGFIQTTVGNIYKSAGAANLPADTVTQADGTIWQKNQDGTYTQIK